MDMIAAIKEMIAYIDIAVAAEHETLACAQRPSVDTMLELLSKRARSSALLSDATGVGLEKSKEKPREELTEKPSTDSAGSTSSPKVLRPKISDFIMKLLADAGEAGLSGLELQTAAAAVGLTKGAIDKSRTRLKEAQMINLKSEGGFGCRGQPNPGRINAAKNWLVQR